ncbi:hypothetical protein REJ26_004343 [Providencia stuartii]|uniref:hypothetical protein n=1 Tax=Providencia TaxID=586 RepID=UPI0019D2F895|nr:MULTISPECIES: hypothetical protein [Providencia]ELR5302481.1 hypothetical protein [Providencia stuartii]MBN6363541.1 hypothetical protein [Providencia huaxiensis]MDW7590947.1 hypothetical protein [Providencia sp. 2023EL-00965]
METKKGKLIPYRDKEGNIIKMETIEERFTRIFYTEPKQKKEEEDEAERTKRALKLKPTTTNKKIKRKI